MDKMRRNKKDAIRKTERNTGNKRESIYQETSELKEEFDENRTNDERSQTGCWGESYEHEHCF